MERRADHRYRVAFRLTVRCDAGGSDVVAHADCVEISRIGVTLACDDVLIGALMAQEHYPRTCKLAFSPLADGCQFEVDCRIVRHRRLSQHRYHLVALFGRFQLGDSASLDACLARAGQAAPMRTNISGVGR